MAKVLVLTIPHRLGQAKAIRRLDTGLDGVREKFGSIITVHEKTWDGHRLQFRLRAAAQAVSGTIEVFEEQIRLEVQLPWLLATIAERLEPLIRTEGALLLEKK
jgi:hypothetical protein